MYKDATTPARRADAVTPSDSTDLVHSAKSLYIGGTGDVKVTTVGGDTVTYKTHPVGYLIGQIARVWSNGTTATNILALYD